MSATSDRADAIAQLRDWIKPGDTVYTILDHVSRSGMSRAIRVVLPSIVCSHCGARIERDDDDPRVFSCERGCQNLPGLTIRTQFSHPNYAIGRALGLRHWRHNGQERDALVVGGCGMDMGFHLVYELSYRLYGHRECSQCKRLIPSDYPTNVTCGECDGEIVGGYRCLGKGACPSNYHVNHRAHRDGPERFDLVHTDGYALRQSWL